MTSWCGRVQDQAHAISVSLNILGSFDSLISRRKKHHDRPKDVSNLFPKTSGTSRTYYFSIYSIQRIEQWTKVNCIAKTRLFLVHETNEPEYRKFIMNCRWLSKCFSDGWPVGAFCTQVFRRINIAVTTISQAKFPPFRSIPATFLINDVFLAEHWQPRSTSERVKE